jgi:dipeptidyl aminopeptidase/acylaminoacyl peptidase
VKRYSGGRLRRTLGLLLATALAGALLAARADDAPLLRPGPQLGIDGIPALRRTIVPVAAEATPAAPRFVAWHPLRTEMLVLMRSGSSAQLHLLRAPQTRPTLLTRGRDAVADARWEPEQGEYLVFRRDQGGDEAFRLYRVAAAGGDAVRISGTGGRVSEYQFMPRGAGMVYISEQLDREDAAQARAAQARLMWVDPLRSDSARTLAEVRGGRFFNLQVTAAGAVLVSRSGQGSADMNVQRLRLSTLDAAPEVVAAAAASARPGADEEVSWISQALRGEYRHLVRRGLQSGARESLLTDIPADLEAVAAPPLGKPWPLALVHNERGFSALRLFNPEAPGAPLKPIAQTLPAGLLRAPQWHPRQPMLAFEHVSAQSDGRIFVFDLEQGALQAWSGREGAANATHATEYTSLRWNSFDGLEISALHIAPPARFTGPRPVLINLHGGPASQARPGALSATHRRLLEDEGMHIIRPNVRGSDGFGKRFLALDDGRLREDAVKDVSALLDLIATRPDMDAKRVVVEGGSYGGYLALAVAVHESARIAGSICRVGIANFVTFLEQTESYRRDNRRLEYGDERDPSMREFLLKISPVTRAHDIRKPLFVVHGRNDPRVPYAEAQQVVRAVRAHGTPVWFLTAEDEGHSVVQADNRDYLTEATLQFVQRLIHGRALD